jgi:membrane protease YdiL (CAAX protease family)
VVHPAGQLRPLGIVRTFAWLAAAFGAAALLSVLITFVAVQTEIWIGTRFDVETVSWITLATATLLFFGIIGLACRRSGWSAIEYLGLARPRGRYVLRSLLVFFLPPALSVIAIQFGSLGAEEPAPATFMAKVFYFIEATIFAPVVEELVFRGFLFRGLAASRLGPVGAIALTALLWSAIHDDRTWIGFVKIVCDGLLLAWLRWRSGSTIPTIAVHSLHNAAGALVRLI